MTIAKTILQIGKRLASPALVGGAQLMRSASNRLTTWAILREYHQAPRIEKTLFGMLRNLKPSDFGPADKTIFVPIDCCKFEAEEFLGRENRSFTPVEISKFRSGECYARILETVRGKDVILLQDFESNNINDALMQTLLMINAAKLASARKVTLLTPDLPYVKNYPQTKNERYDYFKLVLNLLFKGAGLDELHLGPCIINRETSGLFLQDILISRNLAPYMIAKGEKRMYPFYDNSQLTYMIGSGYYRSAREIIRELRLDHAIVGRDLDIQLKKSHGNHKINLVSDSSSGLTGRTVFIFQTCNTGRVNDDLMEALLMVYTAKKKGARQIVLVMPYLPYNRQERKDKTRVPISAKVVANALVEAAGATQIITMDLHAPATQGFVNVPMQHITALHELAKFFRQQLDPTSKPLWIIEHPSTGAPDVGRGRVARKMGQAILGEGYDIVIIDKDRPQKGESEVAGVIGRVRDRDIILFDDMIDSAGTIINGSRALKAKGAKRVYVACIHPVFSEVRIRLNTRAGQAEYQRVLEFIRKHGLVPEEYIQKEEDAFTVNALIRLQADRNIDGLIFTDTMIVPEHLIVDKERVKVLSVAPLLANVSAKILHNESLENYQYEGQ